MKKLYIFTMFALVATLIVEAPVQAAKNVAASAAENTPEHLILDMVCDSSPVCRIQNASLGMLNGQVIWLYQLFPGTSDQWFGSLVSLELLDGSSRGFVVYKSDGGYFSIGRNGEGSLSHFQAYGTISKAMPGSTNGTFIFHCDGTFHFN